jgi:serine/threonine protein kinase
MVEYIGQQLGNYRLVRLLGKGGFADVYIGEHIYLKNQAAVKVLHARVGEADLENFLHEARILVKLIHPHIVRILDFGVTDATPFLAMDYALGGTLRQRYPSGTRVPLPLVVTYVKQVASALQFAHNQKLVHCDVKPENILLDKSDSVLLSDFGIATIAQSTHHPRLDREQATGTIGYMAPEQIQSNPRAASDQYALGIVTYEWLCGVRPFRGSFTEIAVKHTMVAPPALREYVPDLSLEVERVVLTALAKAPEARFPSVMAFAAALERAVFDPQEDETTLLMMQPPSAGRPVFYQSKPPVQTPMAQAAGAEQGVRTPGRQVSENQGWFAEPTTDEPLVSGGGREFVPTAPPGLPYEQPVKRSKKPLLISLIVFLVLLLAAGTAVLALNARKPAGGGNSATVTTGPSPSPSLPTAVYPAIAGNYSGNIHNSPANVDATMTLTINQNQSHIDGQFSVAQPLLGNGPFTGTVTTKSTLQFTVNSAATSAPILFQGTMQPDHSLSGTYCSVSPQGQCNANYGGYGTWQVSKV